EKNLKTRFLRDFVFFRTREIPYLYNTLSDKDAKFKVFDVEFTEGAFIAREVVKTTVMHIQLNHNIPVFTLDKEEGLLDFMYKLAGFQNLNIENHPDFKRRFYLSGENEEQVRELFTDELVLFFESNPFYHVESNGTTLLITKKERLLSVQEIKAMISYGKRLCALFEKFDDR
ncbi:MAG: SulP family inorganic anion transporter, partial [Aurantibacter sp.]